MKQKVEVELIDLRIQVLRLGCCSTLYHSIWYGLCRQVLVILPQERVLAPCNLFQSDVAFVDQAGAG